MYFDFSIKNDTWTCLLAHLWIPCFNNTLYFFVLFYAILPSFHKVRIAELLINPSDTCPSSNQSPIMSANVQRPFIVWEVPRQRFKTVWPQPFNPWHQLLTECLRIEFISVDLFWTHIFLLMSSFEACSDTWHFVFTPNHSVIIWNCYNS